MQGMVEDESVQEAVLRTGKVDTIVSEPIGVMLLHERMVGIEPLFSACPAQAA